MNSDEQNQRQLDDTPKSMGFLEAKIELQQRQIEWLFSYLIRKSHSASWSSIEKDFPRK